MLKSHNLDPKIRSIFCSSTIAAGNILELCPALLDSDQLALTTNEIQILVSQAYEQDKTVKNYMKKLSEPGPHRAKNLNLSRCSIRNNRLYYDNLIFVPDSDKLKHLLIKCCYEHPSEGHHGRNKVYA